ncbi:hypothetical protein [Psychrobacter sp.]|uniref:hypothetical protein n=1 Tax=Psychrobacter sp. TaxID=56811 RepID=UPI0025E7C569|nr:hypothetical protein [Psychrobacter sp.]
MLQVTDNGANITLSGKSEVRGDGVFWFSMALLIGALGVAISMSLLPERLAIGALGLLIVGSYFFNRLRSRQKGSQTHISSGIVKVQSGLFVHNHLGKIQRISLAADDTINVNGKALTIIGANGGTKCQVSGFDSEKEAQVMQAILQGQQFGKRNANIKMQSS